MKSLKKTAIYLTVLLTISTGTTYAEVVDSSNAALLDLLDQASSPTSQDSYEKQVEDTARLQAILQYAKDTAVKKGLKQRLLEIRQDVKRSERDLDTVYNFSPLMINGRVVPPVIIAAKDLYNQPNSGTVQTSSAYFKILQQAHFSSTPPNWRGYLTFPISQDEVLSNSFFPREMLPRNAAEKKQWQQTLIKGWQQGREQADQMLEYALNKLNRDYIGMLRFHTFVLERKISLPSISSTSLALSASKDEMILDQNMLTIRQLPAFNADLLRWRTWISPVTKNPSGEVVTKESLGQTGNGAN